MPLSLVPVREAPSEAAARLLEILMEYVHRQKVPDRQCLMERLLILGLFDQLIQLIIKSSHSGDKDIENCLNNIEKLIDNRYYNTLQDVNPVLTKKTLELVFKSLKDEEDKELTMNVITTVIFTLTIFLIKLDSNEADSMRRSITELELAFAFMAQYLNELTFSTSDILIRATNVLVVAIKTRLDALAHSELIRESLKTLIETVASRCLIESRYKSAAILYSHIEDNVNAVKSLMRAGNPDTVINFALLVRNLTVNRITINYLKHLKVDVKIIEDFTARART